MINDGELDTETFRVLSGVEGKTVERIEVTNESGLLAFVMHFTDGSVLRVGSDFDYGCGGAFVTVADYK